MADVQHFAGIVTPSNTTATLCGDHVSWGHDPNPPDPWGFWWSTDDNSLKFTDGSSVVHTVYSLNSLKRSITIHMDGGAGTPATGAKQRWSAPCACTITGWVLLADAAGDAVIDVLRSTYSGFPTIVSIAGTDKPTLAAVQKNENLGPLSNWTSVAIAAGDVLEFNLDSVVTCKILDLTLNITVT